MKNVFSVVNPSRRKAKVKAIKQRLIDSLDKAALNFPLHSAGRRMCLAQILDIEQAENQVEILGQISQVLDGIAWQLVLQRKDRLETVRRSELRKRKLDGFIDKAIPLALEGLKHSSASYPTPFSISRKIPPPMPVATRQCGKGTKPCK